MSEFIALPGFDDTVFYVRHYDVVMLKRPQNKLGTTVFLRPLGEPAITSLLSSLEPAEILALLDAASADDETK